MSCRSQVVLCAGTDMNKITVAFRNNVTARKKEQDGQFSYNVTLRRIRATIVAVEKQ